MAQEQSLGDELHEITRQARIRQEPAEAKKKGQIEEQERDRGIKLARRYIETLPSQMRLTANEGNNSFYVYVYEYDDTSASSNTFSLAFKDELSKYYLANGLRLGAKDIYRRRLHKYSSLYLLGLGATSAPRRRDPLVEAVFCLITPILVL